MDKGDELGEDQPARVVRVSITLKFIVFAVLKKFGSLKEEVEYLMPIEFSFPRNTSVSSIASSPVLIKSPSLLTKKPMQTVCDRCICCFYNSVLGSTPY